jgi:hypothetical protein
MSSFPSIPNIKLSSSWFPFHFLLSPNMEAPIILNYFKSSISCFCMILLYASTLNPVFALKNCTFPAIFNFGDSNSDTGGFAAALKTPKPPSGETFFHMPAGRFSDGRLIIDFMGMLYTQLSSLIC